MHIHLSYIYVLIFIALCVYVLINRIFFLKDRFSSRASSKSPRVPFSYIKVPVSELDKQIDPVIKPFHMTRWSFNAQGSGCSNAGKNYRYSHAIPFIRQFHMSVGFCKFGGYRTCIYTAPKFENIILSNQTIRIHVHADFRHHKYFIVNVLDYFEKRFLRTNSSIMVYSGGGDTPTAMFAAERILQSKCISRWAVEQNSLYDIQSDKRVVEIPVGTCLREVTSTEVMFNSHSNSYKKFISRRSNNRSDTSSTSSIWSFYSLFYLFQKSLFYRSDKNRNYIKEQLLSYTLLDAIENASKMDWKKRKNRVLICFSRDYHLRKRPISRDSFIDWARTNCTICDLCSVNKSQIPHTELWALYSQYKFILSPHGNGFDCGRTWEILLMGAIPVIQHFAGVRGYLEAGLSVLSVSTPAELNAGNLSNWLRIHTVNQNSKRKLSYEFWNQKIFGTNSNDLSSPIASPMGRSLTTIKELK